MAKGSAASSLLELLYRSESPVLWLPAINSGDAACGSDRLL
jgi:hypothetical protein